MGQAIGVSRSSMKRWVDEGRIRAPKTMGGHRRIAVSEAIRFIRESGLPIKDPEILGLVELGVNTGEPDTGVAKDGIAVAGRGDRDRETGGVGKAGIAEPEGVAGRLVSALLRGDEAAFRREMIQPYVKGESLPAFFDGPFQDAMARIGEIWLTADNGIMIEHRSVTIAVGAMHRLMALMPEPEENPDAPLAIGGAIAGDPYLLPSLVGSVVLRSEGWRVVNLGPDTPASAFASAVDDAIRNGDSRGLLLWVSVSVSEPDEKEVEALLSLAASLSETGGSVGRDGARGSDVGLGRVPMLLGGRGVSALRVPSDAAARVLPSMSALMAFAEGLRAGR